MWNYAASKITYVCLAALVRFTGQPPTPGKRLKFPKSESTTKTQQSKEKKLNRVVRAFNLVMKQNFSDFRELRENRVFGV